jgi:hypothetical protein
LLVEAMMLGHADFSCFKGGAPVIDSLRERFHTQLSKAQCSQVVLALIDRSTNHWRTRLYDRYQRCCVGRVHPKTTSIQARLLELHCVMRYKEFFVLASALSSYVAAWNCSSSSWMCDVALVTRAFIAHSQFGGLRRIAGPSEQCTYLKLPFRTFRVRKLTSVLESTCS